MSDGPDLQNDTPANDSFDLGAGDDRFGEQYGGTDVVHGGPGRDLLAFGLAYDPTQTGPLVLSGTQTATGFTGNATWGGGLDSLTFDGFEDLYFNGLSVGNFDDSVATGDGDDTANLTLAGNDLVRLGAGMDTLFVTEGSAIVVSVDSGDPSGSGGTVTGAAGSVTFAGIDSFILYAPAQAANVLMGGEGDDVLSGGGTLRGMGGNDGLAGGPNADLLLGYAGDDVIDGGGGNDEYYGGAGNDRLIDSAGDDRLFGEDGDDLIEGGEGNDTLFGGAGDDRLTSGYNPGPVLVNDELNGGAGDDILDGSFSNTRLVLNGDEGNDRLMLMTFAFANGGEGDDVLEFYLPYDMDVTMAAPVPDPGGGYSGTIGSSYGALPFSGIEHFAIRTVSERQQSFTTGDGNDSVVLVGRERDYLDGRGGDDFLDGGVNSDTMIGGRGNDVFIVDNVGDEVIELAGEGFDDIRTALSQFSLTAFANVEILTGTSASHQRLTGNAADNVIRTGAGNDALIGLAGADTLAGGAGNDGYILEDGLDTIVEAAGGGYDTVYTTASYSLNAGAEVEVLSVYERTTTDTLNLAGNEFGQAIYGNNGTNFLNGNGGADVLYGLAGDDAYLVDWFDDTVLEDAGGGTDTVYAMTHFTLTAGAEVEVLSVYDRTTSAAINFNGNEFGQAIYGNAGSNVIDGKGGNDTIYLMGGTDTVVFTAPLGAGNVDAVVSFTSGDDKLQLDSVTFAGLAPGALPASAFALGAAADADDRVVYDQASGQLWFDADGSAAGAAVVFATLDPGTVLAASDFIVV